MADDSPGRFEVSEPFLFLGRTFAEYRSLFDLDPTDLVGRRVLDCPGGPASFAATATALGADPVAIDPAYGPPADRLATTVEAAIERTATQLREKRDLFAWDYYGDVDGRVRHLRAAGQRFLADYGHRPSRYLRGRLPRLPLADDAVDLALSANFLFLYDDRLDEAFHHAALAELCRVTREEVRLFPLASLDRTRSALVEPVCDRLRDRGHEATLREVPYEFRPGGSPMLVVTPDGG